MTPPTNPVASGGADAGGKPRRAQLSRKKGWRMPENTVSVARPGRWGNPFRILNEEGFPLIVNSSGHSMNISGRDDDATNWHNCHAQAVALFREQAVDGLPNLAPLRGKNLACWCALDVPCHADVLLELANEPIETIPRLMDPELFRDLDNEERRR